MITNKFVIGQRVTLIAQPSCLVVVGDGVLNYTDSLRVGEVYHVQDYVGNFNGSPLITLRECGDTQYLETLFIAAKRPRTEAVRIPTKPSSSRRNKV